MGMVANQYEVYLINLDPTIGHEIKKDPTVPCNFARRNESQHHHRDNRPDDDKIPSVSDKNPSEF